ncbi:Nudix hydrolase 20, chloroplastic [Quillaja saponaria]|uniref:Nudix hydrolase 20, chloroplastic n=1 Tax=Quillaja saponaria TaxID=32244 RepID=A0AAD7VFM3_QUISA|nr:Nudix hydrolase 20, chloroplastic [Quillaja saponaria]
MACADNLGLSLPFPLPFRFTFKSFRQFSMRFPASTPNPSRIEAYSINVTASSVSVSSANDIFGWDDVLRISQSEISPDDSSNLRGYFEKVQLCNRRSDLQSEFLPFVIENQIVGYIHMGFAVLLRSFKDVFIFPKDDSFGGRFGYYVTLDSKLATAEKRTSAVGDVVKSLGEEWIPGIRNELFPVTTSFGAPILFSLERAAAPYFGVQGYATNLNGYVERDGQKYLWVAKRSQLKPTYPGRLDHLVAGGMPHGIACRENLVKECKEEAGIPRYISNKAIAVGAVSFLDIDGYSYNRYVLFCYDLKLSESFEPKNEDGEVESFKLIPAIQVADVVRKTQFFTPNCALVIIDFMFRHGYISPEYVGYLELLRSLRN